MTDADHETADLTPMQKAELEEQNTPPLKKLERLVAEADDRMLHGVGIPSTFVNELRAVLNELSGPAVAPDEPPPVPAAPPVPA